VSTSACLSSSPSRFGETEVRLLINAGNRSLAVVGGEIVATSDRFDVVLDMPQAEVWPGLINAHDHLHRNHYGRLGRPPYQNARQWALDIQSRYHDHIAQGRQRPRRAALELGAWKNLFAGVTTVVHHDPWEAEFERDFPLRVLKIRSADSVSMSSDLEDLQAGGLFCLHVAEGIDRVAAEEVRRLAELGLLTDRLIAVHGVGMDEAGTTSFRRSGAALVWCPSSNLFLFGRAAGEPLLREGVDVLLGSDSRLTGAGDLLDEIRCARSLGVLTRPLLEACAEDVALVLVGGVPRVARPDVAARLGPIFSRAEAMQVGPITRWTNPGPAGPTFTRTTP
jgi:cytosine/adenosine deaminase-related metal-dependent hydrolase